MRTLDDNIRSLQKAVDSVYKAHIAFKEFMNECEGNRWGIRILAGVCDAQNALIALLNAEGWDDIVAGADRMPRPGEGHE
jgi:hypothetical protein